MLENDRRVEEKNAIHFEILNVSMIASVCQKNSNGAFVIKKKPNQINKNTKISDFSISYPFDGIFRGSKENIICKPNN